MNGNIFNDEIDFEKDWLWDARRYYANIVGKYGLQVQALLKKATALDIRMICSLHGPIWRTDLSYFIDKYEDVYKRQVLGRNICAAMRRKRQGMTCRKS